MQKSHGALLAFIIGMGMSLSASAADNACLLEGTLTTSETIEEVKDCIQNAGVTEAVLKATCQGVSDMAVAIGAPPAKITYIEACPKPMQATCAGFFGQPMTSYYYNRSEKLLASSKKGCEMLGGKWN